jgi:hypothetical protein
MIARIRVALGCTVVLLLVLLTMCHGRLNKGSAEEYHTLASFDPALRSLIDTNPDLISIFRQSFTREQRDLFILRVRCKACGQDRF